MEDICNWSVEIYYYMILILRIASKIPDVSVVRFTERNFTSTSTNYLQLIYVPKHEKSLIWCVRRVFSHPVLITGIILLYNFYLCIKKKFARLWQSTNLLITFAPFLYNSVICTIFQCSSWSFFFVFFFVFDKSEKKFKLAYFRFVSVESSLEYNTNNICRLNFTNFIYKAS